MVMIAVSPSITNWSSTGSAFAAIERLVANNAPRPVSRTDFRTFPPPDFAVTDLSPADDTRDQATVISFSVEKTVPSSSTQVNLNVPLSSTLAENSM